LDAAVDDEVTTLDLAGFGEQQCDVVVCQRTARVITQSRNDRLLDGVQVIIGMPIE
jgi:hypothetical protein